MFKERYIKLSYKDFESRLNTELMFRVIYKASIIVIILLLIFLLCFLALHPIAGPLLVSLAQMSGGLIAPLVPMIILVPIALLINAASMKNRRSFCKSQKKAKKEEKKARTELISENTNIKCDEDTLDDVLDSKYELIEHLENRIKELLTNENERSPPKVLSFEIKMDYDNTTAKPGLIRIPSTVPKAITKAMTTALNEQNHPLITERTIKHNTTMYIKRSTFLGRKGRTSFYAIMLIDLKAMFSAQKKTTKDSLPVGDATKASTVDPTLSLEIIKNVVTDPPKAQQPLNRSNYVTEGVQLTTK